MCDGIAVDYVNQLLFYTDTFQDIIVVVSLANADLYKTIINDSLDEPRDIIVDSINGYVAGATAEGTLLFDYKTRV